MTDRAQPIIAAAAGEDAASVPDQCPPPCARFQLGCVCGPCVAHYIRTYANSCTYGTRAS